jgi:hypothetical protein
MRVQVVTSVVGEHDGDLQGAGIPQRQPAAEKGMVDVDDVHALQESFGFPAVTKGQVVTRILQRQAARADDARLAVVIIKVAKGENEHLVPRAFEVAFIQVDVICDSADVRFVGVYHHADAHVVSPKSPTLCESSTLLYTLSARHIFIGSH